VHFSVDNFAKVNKDTLKKFKKLLRYSSIYILKGLRTNYTVANSLYNVLKEKEMYI
jgi:hypothetical protein